MADWQNHTFYTNLTLTFDIKENKLTIPESYYDLIVIGYIVSTKRRNKRTYRVTNYKKSCKMTIDGTIFCDCKDKDDFGILSFYFNGTKNSRIDIDIRDYVHYDNSSDYKCRVDISLSKNDEFIVGLKGLNNTILSFNMEEKKIKFFHKAKKSDIYMKTESALWVIIIVILLLISICC